MSDTSHDGTTARRTELLATFRRAVVQRFTAIDLVTLLYVAVATVAVLAFTADDRTGWAWLLVPVASLIGAPQRPIRCQTPSSRLSGFQYPRVLKHISAAAASTMTAPIVIRMKPDNGFRFFFDLAFAGAGERSSKR